jgi:Holliday junction DNA helicase RuvA
MIAFVEGELTEKQPTQITVNVGGIGLAIHIPLSSFQALGALHSRVRVETYLHVREDVLQLYGFSTTDEKRLFEMLISLSGIGPGMALNILSGTTVADFTTAILTEDVKQLATLPKIGKKTAQRLIMELRDKMGKMDVDASDALPLAASGDQSDVTDAVLGLIALGYDQPQARQMVARITGNTGEALSAEQIIRQVLQQGGR